jgi:hypothetical protein
MTRCPFWVISGHFAVQSPCPLYSPKADMCSAFDHVCFGPKADIDNQVDQLVSAWKNMKQLEIRGRQLSRTAINGMGLWSNFKYLPNADWVNHAQARERG